jgi:hypothetical protein
MAPEAERSTGIDPHRLVYRWDLDKTYLRTEFDTVRDIFRTAFETPDRKRTVPGAAALLREIRSTEPAGVFILSGSPEQMRRVLEAKLRLDGIKWDSFTLKPSLKNLMRGRFRFLRDQVGYKLGCLLESRVAMDATTAEVLFGDDAEADAFIYSLYADLCSGRVGQETLVAVLERAKVYPEDIPTLVRLSSRLTPHDSTRRIFIHLDRVSPTSMFAEFGHRVCPFYNYFQPAVVLLSDGLLGADAALRVGAEIVIEHAFSPDALSASFMDLVRRGYAGRSAASALVTAVADADPRRFAGAAPALEAFADDLETKAPSMPAPEPIERPVIDYVGLFSRDKARARAARRRARLRKR